MNTIKTAIKSNPSAFSIRELCERVFCRIKNMVKRENGMTLETELEKEFQRAKKGNRMSPVFKSAEEMRAWVERNG